MNMNLYKTPDGERAVMAIYDAALRNWPVPYTTQTLLTRHGDTFVITCGDVHKPPLVLLHGAGTNSAIWAGDIRDYCRAYHVYAVDLIGEAGRSAPNRPAWDGAAFAEWLEDVFNQLELNEAVIVGISQGAWSALKFATWQPNRTTKLVLLTPGGIVPDRRSFLVKAIGLSLLGQWGVRRLVTALFGDQPVPDGVIDMVTQVSAAFKPRIGVLPIFSDADLRRLTMPVLLVGGNKDIMRDMPMIEARLRQFVPQLSVAIIAGGGHALINTSVRVMKFLTA